MKTKPTKSEILTELKKKFGLEVEEITDEVYEKVTRGHERGISVKTMASRVRFYLTASSKEDAKEKIPVEGVFLGSRDLVSQRKPLGKNKSQIITFLKKGEDGKFSVFKEPNTPTHFKAFKKDVFGKLVSTDMAITASETYSYVTPGNISVINEEFEIDTGLINVCNIDDLTDMEDYTEVAVVGTMSSIRALRVPMWEVDNWENEDYPLVVNDAPVFQAYMRKQTEDGPVVRVSVHPIHMGRPYIQMEDFEALWDIDADIEEDIRASFADRKVILFGQKRRNNAYDGVDYIDFDANAIIEINNEPIVAEYKTESPASKVPTADKEQKKNQVRMSKVKETVEAFKATATLETVKEMHDAKFFNGVSDDELQAMLDSEMVAQGYESVEAEIPVETKEEEKESEDVWAA